MRAHRKIGSPTTSENDVSDAAFLADHGSGCHHVLIARGGEGHLPFGVLEVDSATLGNSILRTDFLAGFADCSASPSSASKLMRNFNPPRPQAMLTREMSHRVKNSPRMGWRCFASRPSTPIEDAKMPLKDAAIAQSPRSQRCTMHLWRPASDRIRRHRRLCRRALPQAVRKPALATNST